MENTHTTSNTTSLGIWLYIMSDCMLFAALFATYAVLHTATAGSVSGVDIFDRSFVLIETIILLTSSFTAGMAVLASRAGKRAATWAGLLSTAALGAVFLSMETAEFAKLIAEGHGPQASAFLSSFFVLVGTHGLHVFAGTLWIFALLAHLVREGVTNKNADRVYYFSLFWHFLDIVWICLFSLVYLLGTLS